MPGPDAPNGPGTGILLTMDRHGCAYVRLPNGKWADERYLRDPLEYTHRTVLSLLKNGWVEADMWDDRANPLRVVRTKKPGHAIR